MRTAAALVVCCAVLLVGQFGLASASEGPLRAEEGGAEVVRAASVSSSTWSTTRRLAQSDDPAPSEGTEPGQDRRYVIGALGIGLVAGVLLIRRRRGKQSFVLQWRKRS
ncbi:hypothetical protein CDG81_03685 [Actinopolyspora erythraea]|uniref:Gram-positive cocci surface proteins LPxTG domain-containing protein n=1 Tax=Actinopolyspora erythraea TaxID=414996 RepID=A0A223RP29_9ACTN|nr:hypothetical protein [Actinopolyspora erythraea]ASU77557.1 hypothetical protein CDG81_03685 [Actinopolyspora erythraea]